MKCWRIATVVARYVGNTLDERLSLSIHDDDVVTAAEAMDDKTPACSYTIRRQHRH